MNYSNYEEMIEEMIKGPIIILELNFDLNINSNKENCVCELKKLVGNSDPKIAKELNPKSLRALFGIDINQNALYCTEIENRGVYEV